MTPHVVHVSQPVEAGVARVVLDLLRDQRDAGWRVELVSPDGWLADGARALGVPWAAWSASRDPGPSVPGEVRSLGALLEASSPDLVHLHSSKAGLAGRLALRGRRPTLFQPHAWSFAAASGLQRAAALRWERTAARWTSLQLACSAEEADEGRRAGIAGPVVVVPNGVDLARFDVPGPVVRVRARAALGLGADAPVAVCVGRLSRQKGQDVALAAWPLVRAARPDAVLLLVGDGPERVALEQAAPPGVQLLGARDDVPALLAAADVVVLPSRWEGLALALLEAMASGRSVVCSDVAGSRSTLLDGPLPAGGAVVPVGDAAALADAVVHRLRDPGVTAAEGAAGRGRVERDHDLRRTTAQVREVSRQVLAGELGRLRRRGARRR